MKKIILSLFVILFFTHESKSVSWTNLGTGLNGRVKSIVIFNGSIYAAGTFTSPKHVAKWSGTAWVAVGNGFNDSVNVLAVDPLYNKLYAGGHFNHDGNNSAELHHIAQWDGTNWVNVGTGGDTLNNFVRAISFSGTLIYAGGAFNSSGTHSVTQVAQFNTGTSQWSQLGDIPAGVVDAIVNYNAQTYIGGGFNSQIRKLSGGVWNTISSGTNAEVNTLAVALGKLWLGGRFASPYPYLCTWNNSSFGSAPNQPNTNSIVYALTAVGNNIVAGGTFTTMGSASVSRIGIYNGVSAWAGLGTGMNGTVLAIANFNGKVVAGGEFTSAGGVGATNIAVTTTTVGIDEPEENIITKTIFPNPFTTDALLKVETKNEMLHPSLKMIDISGKEINPVIDLVSFNRAKHEVEFRINRAGLPAGIYFYDLKDDEVRIATGKIIVE